MDEIFLLPSQIYNSNLLPLVPQLTGNSQPGFAIDGLLCLQRALSKKPHPRALEPFRMPLKAVWLGWLHRMEGQPAELNLGRRAVEFELMRGAPRFDRI